MSALYVWKDGCNMGVPAQVAGAELERIRGEEGGVLRPSDVVEAARPEAAPLHPCFTWDDAEAAERWRDGEARAVIRNVRVLRCEPGSEERRPVLAYVHVPQDDNRQCYQPVEDVLSDVGLRDTVLTQALAMLNGLRRRFEHLEELAEVFAAIDEAATQHRRRRPTRAAGGGL